MNRSLDLDAHLTLTLNHRDVLVEAEHDQVVMKLPDLRTGMALMAQIPNQNGTFWLKVLPPQLQSVELTVSIEIAGRTLARMGNQARPNWLARRLNMDAVEFHPIALVWTWLTHRQRHSSSA